MSVEVWEVRVVKKENKQTKRYERNQKQVTKKIHIYQTPTDRLFFQNK